MTSWWKYIGKSVVAYTIPVLIGVLLCSLYPDYVKSLLIISCVEVVVMAVMLEIIRMRNTEKVFRMVYNDATVFATFIRQLWKDDPILANAIWKKSIPKDILPPWHQSLEKGNERG